MGGSPPKTFPQIFKNLRGWVQIFECVIRGPPRPSGIKLRQLYFGPFPHIFFEILQKIDDFSNYAKIPIAKTSHLMRLIPPISGPSFSPIDKTAEKLEPKTDFPGLSQCISRKDYKKLSYRRVTAQCVLSVVILPITTPQCRNYLYDKPMVWSWRFSWRQCVINKPTTVELCIYHRRLAVAKLSKSTM